MVESPPNWIIRWMPSFIKRRRVANWRRKAHKRRQLQRKMAEASVRSASTSRELKRIRRPGHPVHLITTLRGEYAAACGSGALEHVDQAGDLVLADSAMPEELLEVTCKKCQQTDHYYQWTRKHNIANAQCCFIGKKISVVEWVRAIAGRSQWQYFVKVNERRDGTLVYRVARWRGSGYESTDVQSEIRGTLEMLCFRGHWSPPGIMPGDHGFREFHVATGADDLVYRLNRGLPPQGALLTASIVAGLALIAFEAPGFFLAINELLANS